MTGFFNIRYLRDPDFPAELIFCERSALAYPLHNHVSVFTIGTVLAGRLWLTVGKTARLCERGGVFVVPPYVPHRLDAEERCALLTLCIGKTALPVGRAELLQAHVQRLLDCSPETALFEDAQRARLLRSVNALTSFRAPPAQDSQLEALKKRLETSPEAPCSVEEMARAAFLSKYHFIRSFQQTAGLTPHQFQLQNRIRKARRLLEQGESVTEAALAAGFFDQSHFIRHFKRQTGLTPSDYRKACAVVPPAFIPAPE